MSSVNSTIRHGDVLVSSCSMTPHPNGKPADTRRSRARSRGCRRSPRAPRDAVPCARCSAAATTRLPPRPAAPSQKQWRPAPRDRRAPRAACRAGRAARPGAPMPSGKAGHRRTSGASPCRPSSRARAPRPTLRRRRTYRAADGHAAPRRPRAPAAPAIAHAVACLWTPPAAPPVREVSGRWHQRRGWCRERWRAAPREGACTVGHRDGGVGSSVLLSLRSAALSRSNVRS